MPDNGYRRRRSSDTRKHLRRLIGRQAGICAICGLPMDESSGQKLEVDHVVPFSKGGSDDVSNLAAVHAYCNRRKSATNMYPIWVDGALLETAGQSSTARSRVPGWWERLTPFDGESRNNRRWNQLNPSLTIDRGRVRRAARTPRQPVFYLR